VGEGLDYLIEMCPRERGLSKQESHDGRCKGFGCAARHENFEGVKCTQSKKLRCIGAHVLVAASGFHSYERE
jgi:hypothetical protein